LALPESAAGAYNAGIMRSLTCRCSTFAAAVLVAWMLASCTGSNNLRGVPRNLPKIDLYGSAATPAHSMERKEYPFAENGDYMTSWAALGGSPASDSDIDRWRSSHGGSVSKKQPSPVKKAKTTASKTRSGGRGGSYTIKPGDTLSAIARRNNTTVAKLKAANALSSDLIHPGKSLKIPK
jgi:hypothetical protein